eukprot:TRINITY_DN61012_c0_g1_i4.p2 TRINITY_DN61012_c0_g1~~TRINITY_DN61012_c0_g1_i4.p2  ORF type:complete len:139 (+),score=42.63 TRINITY_DN61012_c0_g1_i4:2-418(+)
MDVYLADLDILWSCIFFFFKQKTAYEMQRGLVGSEMCIRDRYMGMSSRGSEGLSQVGEDNPYREPPLEKIFTYKDEQKELKMMERKQNAKLNIWEKNKPKNEGLIRKINDIKANTNPCLLYTSPSPRDLSTSRMPSSA